MSQDLYFITQDEAHKLEIALESFKLRIELKDTQIKNFKRDRKHLEKRITKLEKKRYYQ